VCKKKPIKEDCYHYKHRSKGKSGCKALCELQCAIRGKCGFYETEEEYNARQEDFKIKYGK
jgi:hypothetical protein